MQNDRKSYALRMLLISSKIFIFRKVTVDLVPLMEKIDATFRVAEILLFEGFTKGFPIFSMRVTKSTVTFRKINIF